MDIISSNNVDINIQENNTKNYNNWEELINFDDLVNDSLLNVINNPIVLENFKNKFIKAISIYNEKEKYVKNRLLTSSLKISKMLKKINLTHFTKKELNNIIKERSKNIRPNNLKLSVKRKFTDINNSDT
jgi:hypothetical protein